MSSVSPHRHLVVAARAAVLALLLIAGCSTGRTPDSDFVREASGADAVVFDTVYPHTGSTENSKRTVVVRTSQRTEDVLAALITEGGWRRLGEGIERRAEACASSLLTRRSTWRRTQNDREISGRSLHASAPLLCCLSCSAEARRRAGQALPRRRSGGRVVPSASCGGARDYRSGRHPHSEPGDAPRDDWVVAAGRLGDDRAVAVST